MTAAELRQLIADIKATSEDSRELSDRVLLACGLRRDTRPSGEAIWIQTTGRKYQRYFERTTDPLTNLQDATLVVPKLWDGHGMVFWPGRENRALKDKAGATLHHVLSSGGGPRVTAFASTPARALTLAGLKARLMEADDG